METKKETIRKMNVLRGIVDSTSYITDDLERIKAILLYRSRHSDSTVKQEIADEWNGMEVRLRHEAFWTFINPNPDDTRYAKSRMYYMFEMLLRCEKDESGAFVDLGARIRQNRHYLFKQCLSIMMDSATDKVPFRISDVPLAELIEEEYGAPFSPFEISNGMFALWFAVKILFGRMWSWFCFCIMDLPQKCVTTETGEAGADCVRDLLSAMVEANEEDLIPTGETLGEYLDDDENEFVHEMGESCRR